MGFETKTLEELDNMHKCMRRSKLTRNSFTIREVEQEIEKRVKQEG